jgi:multicomponent Na+:H+ antiporter subunit C
MEEFIHSKFNYWIYVLLMMIGLWGMIAKNNLIKKLIGMSIFQTAIILFYVSIAVKEKEANIPILPHHGHDYSPLAAAAHAGHGDGDGGHKDDTGHNASPEGHGDHGDHGHAGAHDPKVPVPNEFANPLPHVLMLTAIVVGVATLGLALAISQKIFKHYGTLEEDELLKKVRADDYV